MMRLIDYIHECDGAATPANTLGMGNVQPATLDSVGSEPLPDPRTAKRIRKKDKFKKLIDKAQ